MLETSHHRNPARPSRRAAILLEIVLSLALFTIASSVLLSSMSMTTQAIQDMKYESEAVDLTETLFSELRLGMRDMEAVSDMGFESEFLEDWTYSIEIQDEVIDLPEVQDSITMQRVEVRVNRIEGLRTFQYRQTRWIAPQDQFNLEEMQQMQPGAGGIP